MTNCMKPSREARGQKSYDLCYHVWAVQSHSLVALLALEQEHGPKRSRTASTGYLSNG